MVYDISTLCVSSRGQLVVGCVCVCYRGYYSCTKYVNIWIIS